MQRQSLSVLNHYTVPKSVVSPCWGHPKHFLVNIHLVISHDLVPIKSFFETKNILENNATPLQHIL